MCLGARQEPKANLPATKIKSVKRNALMSSKQTEEQTDDPEQRKTTSLLTNQNWNFLPNRATAPAPHPVWGDWAFMHQEVTISEMSCR